MIIINGSIGNDQWRDAYSAWDESTEAGLATNNTFVCLFENPVASSDEYGQGGGLTGTDLVLSELGDVTGAAGTPPLRYLDGLDNMFAMSANVWEGLIKNSDTWSVMMKVQGRTAIGIIRYFFDFANDATHSRIIIGRNTDNKLIAWFFDSDAASVWSSTTTTDAFTDTTTWLGMWWDGTNVRCGFTTAGKPTAWSDFEATKRLTAAASNLTQSATGCSIGSRFAVPLDNWCYSGIYYVVVSNLCLIDNES